MKHMAHPVIGDTTHGDGRHNAFFRERYGCRRLLLVAIRVELEHPLTSHPLTISAAPAADFQVMVDALPWRADAGDGGHLPIAPHGPGANPD